MHIPVDLIWTLSCKLKQTTHVQQEGGKIMNISEAAAKSDLTPVTLR